MIGAKILFEKRQVIKDCLVKSGFDPDDVKVTAPLSLEGLKPENKVLYLTIDKIRVIENDVLDVGRARAELLKILELSDDMLFLDINYRTPRNIASYFPEIELNVPSEEIPDDGVAFIKLDNIESDMNFFDLWKNNYPAAALMDGKAKSFSFQPLKCFANF